MVTADIYSTGYTYNDKNLITIGESVNVSKHIEIYRENLDKISMPFLRLLTFTNGWDKLL